MTKHNYGGLRAPIPVVGTSIATGEKIRFKSANDAERVGGFCQSRVSKCLRGESKSHGGYIWEKDDGQPTICPLCGASHQGGWNKDK